jgi:hypothetical protein
MYAGQRIRLQGGLRQVSEVFGHGIVGQSEVGAAESSHSENEGNRQGASRQARKNSISFNHSAPPQ